LPAPPAGDTGSADEFEGHFYAGILAFDPLARQTISDIAGSFGERKPARVRAIAQSCGGVDPHTAAR
jgi:hypothetical protein